MSTATAQQHLDDGERYSAVPLFDGSEWYVVDWAAPDPPQDVETHADQRTAERRAKELNAEACHRSGLEGGTRP